jgi:hypothetical protein
MRAASAAKWAAIAAAAVFLAEVVAVHVDVDAKPSVVIKWVGWVFASAFGRAGAATAWVCRGVVETVRLLDIEAFRTAARDLFWPIADIAMAWTFFFNGYLQEAATYTSSWRGWLNIAAIGCALALTYALRCALARTVYRASWIMQAPPVVYASIAAACFGAGITAWVYLAWRSSEGIDTPVALASVVQATPAPSLVVIIGFVILWIVLVGYLGLRDEAPTPPPVENADRVKDVFVSPTAAPDAEQESPPPVTRRRARQ